LSIAETPPAADLTGMNLVRTEEQMAKIYKLLVAIVEWSRESICATDELPGLSARDWADVPAYHPAERQNGCRC
jgi:hypothetical protein